MYNDYIPFSIVLYPIYMNLISDLNQDENNMLISLIKTKEAFYRCNAMSLAKHGYR